MAYPGPTAQAGFLVLCRPDGHAGRTRWWFQPQHGESLLSHLPRRDPQLSAVVATATRQRRCSRWELPRLEPRVGRSGRETARTRLRKRAARYRYSESKFLWVETRSRHANGSAHSARKRPNEVVRPRAQPSRLGAASSDTPGLSKSRI